MVRDRAATIGLFLGSTVSTATEYGNPAYQGVFALEWALPS